MTLARVRPATLDDAPAIGACLEAAFAPYRPHYTPAAYADTVPGPGRLADRFASMTVLVAEAADGAILGTLSYAATGAGDGHLRGLAVRPERTGSGIAAALLAAAEATLREGGCTCVTLDTTAPLRRAIRFYEAHGYRPTGRVADFFGMPLHEYAKRLEPAGGALGR
jgi:ribosomal protein S18 acetylase RimI-like enzyme